MSPGLSCSSRWYRFGLSYTTFSFSNLSISKPKSHNEALTFSVAVTVTNEGPVAGSEVVQIYMTLPDNGLTTPKSQLRGFGKAKDLKPGKSESVAIHLDKYAVSFWDAARNVWSVRAGTYDILVGKSSDNIVLKGALKLNENFEWVGL